MRGIEWLHTRRNARISTCEGDKSRIIESEICDKEANTTTYCILKTLRNGFHNCLSELCYGNDDVYDTADENHCKRLLPYKSACKADCICEKRIEAHSRGNCIWNIGKESHDKRSDSCGETCCNKYTMPAHPCLAKHIRIYEYDVGHSEERCKAGYDFGLYISLFLFEAEEILHTSSFWTLNRIRKRILLTIDIIKRFFTVAILIFMLYFVHQYSQKLYLHCYQNGVSL